jgi:signal transduction histidine kinase
MAFIPRTIRYILLIDLLLIGISLVGIYQIAERPTISGSFLKKEDGIYVRKLIPGHEAYVFQMYDRIVSIDHKPVASPTELEFILDRYRIGDRVDVTVERDGEMIILSTELTAFFKTSYIYIVLIVGLFYLFVAILVIVKRPENKAARVFHWASVMVAMIIMLTWGSYSIQPTGLGHFIRLLNTIAYILTPVLFFHLTLRFPKEQHWGNNVLRLLYLCAAGIIVWIAAAFVLAAEPLARIAPVNYVRAYDVGRIFFSLCVIASVINIQRTYFKTQDEVQRRKLRWVMLGLSAVPLVFIGLWQLPQTFFDQAWIQEEIIVLVSALIPITFSISIVRYHLFNIDRIFSRATVYTIVIAVVLGVYIFIVGVAADFVGKKIAMSSIFVPAVAAIFVALIFDPLRRSVQLFVDKTYFRMQYDYREAMRVFTDEIKDIHDSNEIAYFIVRKAETLLPVDCLCIVTTDQNGGALRTVIKKNMPADPAAVFLPDEAIDTVGGLHLFGCEDFIETGADYRIIDPSAMPGGISLIVSFPLENDDRRWYLFVGKKKSETRFSIEDIDLIKSFVYHGSVVIGRIHLQRKLLLEQQHAHQLEELNRLKSFFVSSVSHDLKTPLTSIRMFAEILQEKKKTITKSEKEYLEIIQGESERLGRLIDNVLEFTKIERGLKEYRMDEIQLNSLVESVLKLFRYQFVLQEVTLKKSLYRREVTLTADRDALVQVMTNLLANAIKYSPGKKHISIATGVRSGRVYIKISDKGKGIDPNDVQDIFKPFYRSSQNKETHADGAGLGLALVHQIVQAHGGSVDVRSTLGKGTTFTVYLPVKNQTPIPPQKAQLHDISLTIV